MLLTPDIILFYTLKQKPSSVEIEAHIKCDLSAIPGQKTKKLAESRSFETCKDINSAMLWLKNVYPWSIISSKSGPNQRNIYNIISSNYRRTLKEKDVALSTIYYLYESEIFALLSKNESRLIQNIIWREPFWSLRTSINPDELATIIQEFCMLHAETNYNVLSKIINVLFKVASNYRHCENAIPGHIKKKLSRVQTALAAVRKVATNKKLSETEFSMAVSICLKKANSNPVYLGLLICLLTGITFSECINLRWCDWISSSLLNFTSLLVYKNVRTEWIGRKIPCIRLLEKALEKEMAIATEKTSEEILSQPILKKVTAKELRDAFRQLLKDLGRTADYLLLLDGDIETDLNDYAPAYHIRHNFQYWLDYAGFNLSEMAYLLGNTVPTTYGKHYTDYALERPQFDLFTKLQRLTPILQSEIPAFNQFTFTLVAGKKIKKIKHKGNGPMHLILQCQILEDTNGLLCIENNHGYNITTQIIKGDD